MPASELSLSSPTSTSSFEQASALIQEGVSIFADAGCHDETSEAIRMFRGALVTMQNLLRDVPQNYLLFSSVCRADEEQQLNVELTEIPGLAEEENCYIHKHAFVLSEEAMRNWQEHDALAFSCAMALFNIAMAFTLEGRRSGNSSVLRRAISIYEKALDIVVCEQEAVCSNTFAFLILATMNNMSYICGHLGLTEDAINIHERLMLFAAHIRHIGNSWPTEVHEIIQKFTHNRTEDTRTPSCQVARSA